MDDPPTRCWSWLADRESTIAVRSVRFGLHMDPIFSTDVEHVNGAVLIHVHGEIDIATCERLRDAIEPHMGRRVEGDVLALA